MGETTPNQANGNSTDAGQANGNLIGQAFSDENTNLDSMKENALLHEKSQRDDETYFLRLIGEHHRILKQIREQMREIGNQAEKTRENLKNWDL